ISVDRLVQEIWRAAQSDADAAWRDLLAAPTVRSLYLIAAGSADPQSAVIEANREIVRARGSSIATDLAKRAIVKSFGFDDRSLGFIASLFREVSSYLVARDVPGYVGPQFRNRTAADIVHFKERLADHVTRVVTSAAAPPASPDVPAWDTFVGQMCDRLAGRT